MILFSPLTPIEHLLRHVLDWLQERVSEVIHKAQL